MSTPTNDSAFPVPPVSPIGGPAWGIALLFPNQGNWSEAEYLNLKSSRLIELSNGCLEVLPVPTIVHQLIVRFLFKLLDEFVLKNAKGVVLFAPLPTRLWEGTIREPDIVYLRPNRVTSNQEPPEGADLVIEVVSDGAENRNRDLVTKRGEYARAGIPEYWIVDPQQRTITVLSLEANNYREHGVFRSGERATSVMLAGFEAQVTEVFAAGDEVAG